MASACVNNINVTQEFPAYGCFNPRTSFSREDSRSSGSVVPEMIRKQIPTTAEEEEEAGDFEFSLVDSSAGGMLPADELFSDGKLVTTTTTTKRSTTAEIAGKCVEMEISKAPRCSSRWRELLGLRRFSKSTTTNPNPSSRSSSLKQFLNRSSRSSDASSSLMNLPLLKDSDSESISISSSRMSLSSSSSSSGHDHEDLPRLSLDNHTANPFAPARSLNPNPPRMRLVNGGGGGSRIGRTQIRRCSESSSSSSSSSVMSRGVSVDSPRLNSSGKIVFQSLERSSSSPSSFNGGYRHNRGMERSYSSNVRVTPVLNVPVCSIKAGSVIFGQFFSNNRASSSASSSHGGGGIIRGRNSTDRI